MKKTVITFALLLIIFAIGIILRMWFISLTPQPFVYDQYEYYTYAMKMLSTPHMLASHSYRSYPYPLLMALVIKIWGPNNIGVMYIVQAVLDSLIGIFIFILLYLGFRQRRAAWIGLILYTTNPFTSGYVGVYLSEILATFFIITTLLCGLFVVRKPTVLGGVLLGFVSGMAGETRNAALLWSALPIVLLLLWVSWRKKYKVYLGIFFGLILTVMYPVYTNWRDYKELSLTKVDSFFAMEFFNGASLKILPPFTREYPPEQVVMWTEYWSEYYPERTREERKAIANKYWRKGLEIIKKDPWDYVRWRFFKMWYVWQKENVFFYEQTNFEKYRNVTYSYNSILLGMALLGIVVGLLHVKQKYAKWLYTCLAATVVYATISLSFSHAEYRLTIPYYPILFIFASLGIAGVSAQISTRKT